MSNNNLGGWAIGPRLFEHIQQLLPVASTILELGSGTGTIELSTVYNVYSVEHSKHYLGLAPKANYIYAPIVNYWYDVNTLQRQLPHHYDLLLVDGPPGHIGRNGFYSNLALFNTQLPIIIDDANRPAEYALLRNVANQLCKQFDIYDDTDNKKYAIIRP